MRSVYHFFSILITISLGIVGTYFLFEGYDFLNQKNKLSNNIALSYSQEDTLDTFEIIESNIPEFISKKETPQGIFTFRGNHTRTGYGTGPVAETPRILWKYPEKPMCALSTVYHTTSQWCGTGWTGQPLVWTRDDGITEIIFGAYDKHIHFVNADTGKKTREPFETGDIIKGTGTLDPDFPLLYIGSRDNYLRILALDDDNRAVELWKLNAHDVDWVWNDDWDASPLIHNDMLYVGGENGWFYAIKLHRGFDEQGNVKVDPQIQVQIPLFNDELIEKTDRNVSIESSPVLFGNTLYVANSAGRIVGFDSIKLEQGVAEIVFDYWAGDDIDATLVIDDKGMLYAAVEYERFNSRSQQVGQLIKLNPQKTNPLVWGISVVDYSKENIGGIWATPALYNNYLYVPTHDGMLLVVDTYSGAIVQKDFIGHHAWGSPSIIENMLIVPSCSKGSIIGYTISDPLFLEKKFDISIGRGYCIESTPSVWEGNIYVGSRDGFMYKLGE